MDKVSYREASVPLLKFWLHVVTWIMVFLFKGSNFLTSGGSGAEARVSRIQAKHRLLIIIITIASIGAWKCNQQKHEIIITIASIASWKCNFPAYFSRYDIPTDRQTKQQTDIWVMCFVDKTSTDNHMIVIRL